MLRILLAIILISAQGCSFYKDDILTQNFQSLDAKVNAIAAVLKAHDERLEVLLPTEKVTKK